MYEIRYRKQAVKVRLKMPKAIGEKIDTELGKIAKDPATYPGDWKRLKGSPFWRLRVGDWRAVCDVVKKELIVYVLKIGSRGMFINERSNY